MYTLLLVVHIVSCFIMVAVILLQSGKGAEIGAAFGGSSQTLFGSRGAATFLSKVTVGTAAVFMLTALSLAVLSKERSVASSVIELQQPGAQSLPAGSAPLGGEPPSSGSSPTEKQTMPEGNSPSGPGGSEEPLSPPATSK
jgi:preprotein translocase subunit SecG